VLLYDFSTKTEVEQDEKNKLKKAMATENLKQQFKKC